MLVLGRVSFYHHFGVIWSSILENPDLEKQIASFLVTCSKMKVEKENAGFILLKSIYIIYILVGGCNPIEKYACQIGNLHQIGVKKYLKPPAIYIYIIWVLYEEQGIFRKTKSKITRTKSQSRLPCPENPDSSSRIDGRKIPSPGHRISSGKSRIVRTYLDP